MSGSEKEENQSLEHVFEKPAELLEKGVEIIEKGEKTIASKIPLKRAEKYWHTLGPGLITGASDDDPSGIATYSQAGARYGFQMLWMSWFTFPLISVIQEMCARIGLVTGHGLAANIRRHYSKRTLYVITTLLFVANTFNIGADLGAMAKGAQLVVPKMNFALLVIGFGVICLVLQIFTTYANYAKYLKYLAFVLLAYIASALMSHLDWALVWKGIVAPTLTWGKDQIFMICAVLGTTISPYLFFWQTSQEVEEQNLQNGEEEKKWHQNVSGEQLSNLKTDVWSGMFFSNLVMFFIMAACAGTLFSNGITNIETAADAALALRPFAGNFAYILFAIGIVGTGMLAIPVLAGSTSYAITESFGWKHGLYRKLKDGYAFYGVIIVSVICGILLNFIGLDPIKALIYSAFANALIAPIIIVFILGLSSNKTVMGPHANKKSANWIGWFTAILMGVSGIAAIWALF
ncbi:MAG: divalent metal cation transporter [Candidatus Pacebacteria bacterium]|nr:divalent metal cation transporter [Candidatus Paceibacterota bacterium]